MITTRRRRSRDASWHRGTNRESLLLGLDFLGSGVDDAPAGDVTFDEPMALTLAVRTSLETALADVVVAAITDAAVKVDICD